MIAEDRRIVEAMDRHTGQTLWARWWEDHGYLTAEWLDLPADAWIRFVDREGLREGVVPFAWYLAHGLDEEERHGDA